MLDYKEKYEKLLIEYNDLQKRFLFLLNNYEQFIDTKGKMNTKKILKEKPKKVKIKYEPIDGEEWKSIDKYPSYLISNLGRIRKGDIILNEYDKYGYKIVSVKDKDGKQRSVSVHRLVCEAFIPNPENKPQVDHINTVRNDNRVENLRWVTPLENITNPLTLEHLEKHPTFAKNIFKKFLNDNVND